MSGKVKNREPNSSIDGDDDYDEGVEEDFIILDVRPNNSIDELVEKVFGDITKASAGKQFLIGGATGWVSGYMANKVGKLAAISLAGSLLVLQIAQHNGYVTVNWTKVQRAMKRARAQAKEVVSRSSSQVAGMAQSFYEDNFFLASGFAGGFLFGFFW